MRRLTQTGSSSSGNKQRRLKKVRRPGRIAPYLMPLLWVLRLCLCYPELALTSQSSRFLITNLAKNPEMAMKSSYVFYVVPILPIIIN